MGFAGGGEPIGVAVGWRFGGGGRRPWLLAVVNLGERERGKPLVFREGERKRLMFVCVYEIGRAHV